MLLFNISEPYSKWLLFNSCLKISHSCCVGVTDKCKQGMVFIGMIFLPSIMKVVPKNAGSGSGYEEFYHMGCNAM
jgi:hypothetical protein